MRDQNRSNNAQPCRSRLTKVKRQVTIFKTGHNNFQKAFGRSYADIKPSDKLVRKYSFRWEVAILFECINLSKQFNYQTYNQKLNHFVKQTFLESEHQRSTNVSIFSKIKEGCRSWCTYHDLRKCIKMIV